MQSIFEKILVEAEALFHRHGVRPVTLDDIAKRLGISKKTIYQHFADKDDIVYQAAKYHTELEQRELKYLLRQAANPLEEMLISSERLCEHTGEVNPNLFLDIQRYYPKAWAVWLEHKENVIIRDITDNLHRGIDMGLYRNDIDPDLMARLRVESVQLGFNAAVFPQSKLRLAAVQKQLMHHFIRGLLTESGLALYNQYNLSHTIV